MITPTSQRIVAFDIVKCLAIYLVIYGHTIQHYSTMDRLDNWAYLFVYSFHMPLFMMISGYFSLSSYKLEFPTFIRKKFKQLIVPVLTFALLMTLWFEFLEHRLIMSIVDYLTNYVIQFSTWLWFLRSLAICYLLTYIGERIPNKGRAIYYFFTIAILLFVDYCNLAIMYPCFLSGLWMRKVDFFNKYSTHRALLASLLMYVMTFTFFNKGMWTVPAFDSVTCVLPYLGMRAYRIAMGLSASVAIIIGLKLLTDRMHNEKMSTLLCSVGQKTLSLYVIQCLVVEIFIPIIAPPIAQSGSNQWLGNVFIFPVVAFMFICICLLVINILSRQKWINLLLFGQ